MGQLNYLNKDEDNKKQQKPPRPSVAPDQTVHTPPIVHYFLGAIGILFGFSANIWQVFTTILALVALMVTDSSHINYGGLGWKLGIAILIACSTQFGLTLLVWRIDSTWKKRHASAPATKGGFIKGYGLATVEVLQHIDLVTSWGIISFVVDTVGDYTFVSNNLQGVPLINMVFLTFLYAISLYALSTVGFVRSVEYIWAGLISSTRYVQQMQQNQGIDK